MSERKLATIRQVKEIRPIENADKIEVAVVDGWEVVVRKDDNIKPNDLVCFIEIDSCLPPLPCYEFLSNRNYRIKTIKLRKQISQGLIIPLFYDGDADGWILDTKYSLRKYPEWVREGEDVTKLLGVTKYIKPSERECYSSTPKKKHWWLHKYLTRFQWYRILTHSRSKSFPDFIPKTDEERVQNCPWVLKDKEGIYYTSEKIDGQSATYFYRKKGWHKWFGICSRAVLKFEHDNSNWSQAAKQLKIKERLEQIGKNIAIQGELLHQRVQGNKYNVNDCELYLFDVWDINKQQYYLYDEFIKFCKLYNFKHVPILNDQYKLPDTVKELIEDSKGKSQLLPIQEREGIVVRTVSGRRVSFKAINPIYLLSEKDE
jgi:hypothetical protein